MNDFTKEELKDLILFVDGGIRRNSHAVELRNKIQSMLEKFCDHQWIYDEQRGRKVCSKCGLSVWAKNE
jgi:hypothetical protein